MKRWLIILSLAMAAYPDFAAAATRPQEVPLWQRLLSVLLPNTTATRPVRRESVQREPVRHEHQRPVKTAALPNSPERIAAPPIPVAAPAPVVPAPRVAAPSVTPTVAPPAAPLKDAEPAIGSLLRPTPAEPPERPRSIKGAMRPNAPELPAAAPQLATPDAPASPPAPPVAPVFPQIAALPPASEPPVGSLPSPTEPAGRARDPRPRSAGCNSGHRVVSAYYWESRRTASGQAFNPHGMTAAHRTLPFGTHLTVTNPRNGQSVEVVINDRGPFVSGVTLDLSLGAAQAIGLHGTGSVCIL
jgi:rare lipoprotein A